MPSPFPGMNPWLEQEGVWHDFHLSYLPGLRAALVTQLGDNYFVSLEENLYIREPTEPVGWALKHPDVAIVRREPKASSYSPDEADVAVLEAPVYASLSEEMDSFTESYIEIRNAEDGAVVTVIEVLSPANKAIGTDRGAYLNKRKRYLHSDVSFIEIDLLRGGPRMPVDSLPTCDYYVLVKRGMERRYAGVWPIQLRDVLPTIPVPLKSPDPDVRLDLQAVLHDVYDRAQYQRRIYRGSPSPRLSDVDTQWADAIIKEHLGR